MPPSLTDAQLRAELQRCLSCETRPCRSGCPANLSPADFIMAARGGQPSDWRRAAAQILGGNPLGAVCGQVCPDSLCMARCSRRALDGPVNIPAIQTAIVRRARALGPVPRPEPLPSTGQRVAVVGAGPAGLGAASVLAKAGHAVSLFDAAREVGGMALRIPRDRLDPEALAGDVEWLLGIGSPQLVLGKTVTRPRDLLARGFAAVIVTAGLGEPVELDVPGRERALHWTRVLGARPPALRGKRVAVVGDGAVAIDCALAALAQGAAHVELFALKALSELQLSRREQDRFIASGVHASFRVRVTAIRGRAGKVTGLSLRKVELPAGQTFHPSRLVDLEDGEHERRDLDAVVVAIGGRAGLEPERHPRVIYAGDLATGPTSVVEAVASGKRAGLEVHQLLAGDEVATCPDRPSCPEGGGACPKRATCPEWNRPAGERGSGTVRAAAGLPVALDCDLLGQRLRSPFLLAPSPFTEGYEQVRRAYESGWAGAVMKEGADGAAVARLRSEFPDRLTLPSLAPGLAGDPDGYLAAAELLAGGAQGVRVGGLVERHGLGILNELQGGLSWWLAERGLPSVRALVGSAKGRPAPPPPPKALAAVEAPLCTGCGNCSRCASLAIALDARGFPTVDEARCNGCGACVEQCATGAIALRQATDRSAGGRS